MRDPPPRTADRARREQPHAHPAPARDGARRRAGGPVEVLAACGFGRSFGIPSRFLARALPGIDASGLWQHLSAAPALPTTAIVMDVGNDILHGVPVATILEWIERRPQL